MSKKRLFRSPFIPSLALACAFTNLAQADIAASNTLIFKIGGTERARISSTGVTVNGVINATQFIGNGSGLTNLPDTSADRLISGTAALVQDSAGTVTQNADGNAFLNLQGAGANVIQLGNGRTTSDYAYIDLVGDATYTDYGLRIIRGNGGANTGSWIQHRGTGGLNLYNSEAAPITFTTTGIERMRVAASGNIGISNTSPAYPLDVTGGLRASGEIISTAGNQFRMVYGNYGAFWRNDGTNTYFLLTASGDQYGTWNTLRPLTINNASGGVSMGNGLAVTGNVAATTFTGNGAGLTNVPGDNLGNHTATTTLNMGANPIQFGTSVGDKVYYYTNAYGRGIESGTLTDWSGGNFRWRIGGTSAAAGTQQMLLNNTGLTVVGTVAATAFSGSGAALTNIDAETLDGRDSTGFIYSNAADVDQYISARVIRNAKPSTGDGMFIGYGNTNSGLTRIYSAGSTSGYYYSDVTGNILRSDGAKYWHASNDGSGSGLDADTLDGLNSTQFLRSDVNAWINSSEGFGRFHFINGGRTYIKGNNAGDNIAITFRSSDDADRVHISHGGDIYSGALGNWLTAFLNQAVRTTSTPTFGNVYLGYVGDWLSNRLDQSVKSNASPTFSNGVATTSILNDGGIQLIRTASAPSPDTTGYLDFTDGTGAYARFMYQKSVRQVNLMHNVAGGVHFFVQGNVNAQGTFNQVSDRRFKTDIHDLDYGLTEISKLRPVTFQWKDQSGDWQRGRKVGLIAQEVENIVPEAVHTSKDKMQTKTVGYNELVPVLIKSVQQLKAENDILKANQATLLERLERLEQQQAAKP